MATLAVSYCGGEPGDATVVLGARVYRGDSHMNVRRAPDQGVDGLELAGDRLMRLRIIRGVR